MTEEKVKHREWVKNAAIIFLSLLLVLTFFSNTILNRTLPEVATKQITSGNIVAQVRVSGTVVADGAYEVKAGQTREIRTVLAKVGNTVSAGDVLFVLGEGESAEIEAAQEQLHSLELSYQRAAINMQNYDYSVDNIELDAAYKQMNAAEDNMNKAYAEMKAHVDMDTDGSPAAVTAEQIAAAAEEVKNAEETLNGLKAEREQRIAEAEKEMNDALKALNALKGVQPVSYAASASYEVVNLLTVRQDNGAVPALLTDTGEEVSPASDSDTADEPSADNPADETDSSSDGTYDDTGDSGEDPADEENGTDEPPLETTPPDTTPDDPLSQAEKRFEDAKARYAELVNTPDSAISAAEANVSQAYEEYNRLVANESNNVYVMAWKAAKDKYDAAYLNYQTLLSSLSQKQSSNNKSAALAWLELNEIKNQIDIQKAKIAELSGGEENVITANVSGIIQSVSITAGNTAAKGDVICTIEVPDLGYTLDATVTSEQARRLHIGDTATVSNYYWGREIIATIKTIQNDPKNPQQNKIISFSVTGDVSAGTELKLSVGSKSASYDTILPNSAIRSDSNGSFVLVIQEKSSPLGNRYMAVRQPIEVLASDDENSAVTGGVESGDFVITTSSKPVNAGDQVRMAD